LKSLMLLANSTLVELGVVCCVSTTLDWKTIESRVKDEGMSFLTITLTNFGKDLEKALDQGSVDSSLFLGFRRRDGLPTFLSGFLSQVFDISSGVLLEVPSIDSIRAIRQFTLMFGKIKLDCTPERVDKALEKYLLCEQEVKAADQSFVGLRKEAFRRIGALLWTDLFNSVEKKMSEVHSNFGSRENVSEIIPKHGPGATADRVRGNAKHNMRTWTSRLENIFPMGEYAFSSYSAFLAEYPNITFLEPGAELPVRVITVPKTLKTPRIIAVEPVYMQYLQQAIFLALSEFTREDYLLRALICSDSQTPNQELAREGSITGLLATLDLSEASDRVSNQHVRALLVNHPLLAEMVDATRTRKADVSGQTVRLAKFASMGSALCFPMEAIVFMTAIFVGIENALNTRMTRKMINSYVGKVRVYGDDIVVPVDLVHEVVESLESFGFKVNSMKSFWTGKFRESCGKEYFNGSDVSIVRVREMLPQRRSDVGGIVSTVALRNNLFEAGMHSTAKHLDSVIERLIPFPLVSPDSSVLGKHEFGQFQTERMCSHLHRPMVKAMVVETRLPSSSLEGDGALVKFFIKRGELPIADEKHLQRAGRPVSVNIKHRWAYSN
jgi:hypothetical protein